MRCRSRARTARTRNGFTPALRAHLARRFKALRWAKAPRLLSLDEVDERPDESDFERDADRRMSMDRLLGLIHSLKPLDRQVVVLYLEGLDAVSIGEVTGSSPGSIATKMHRLKKLLTRQFQERGRRGE